MSRPERRGPVANKQPAVHSWGPIWSKTRAEIGGAATLFDDFLGNRAPYSYFGRSMAPLKRLRLRMASPDHGQASSSFQTLFARIASTLPQPFDTRPKIQAHLRMADYSLARSSRPSSFSSSPLFHRYPQDTQVAITRRFSLGIPHIHIAPMI